MSLSKELLHISTSTRIISDHLNFLHELEEKEIRYGPRELPRPKLRDRQNPFDMSPNDFRRTFGMTREAFSQLLSMIEPQLSRERDRRNGNILLNAKLGTTCHSARFHILQTPATLFGKSHHSALSHILQTSTHFSVTATLFHMFTQNNYPAPLRL